MDLPFSTKLKIALYVIRKTCTSPLYLKFDPDDTKGYYANPNPYNKVMHEKKPIFFCPKIAAWVCSLDRQATFELAKDERFSTRFPDWQFAPPPKPDSDQDALDKILSNLLMSIPKDDHTRVRRLVQPAFLPRNIKQMEDMIERIVKDALDDLPDQFDLVDITTSIPLTVMAELVGFDAEDFDKLQGLNESIIGTYSTEKTDPKLAIEGINVLQSIIQNRMDNPGDDFISHLLSVSEEDGDALSLDEVTSFVGSLLAAGADTTKHFLNSNMEIFLKEGVLPKLRKDPHLIPAAVSEASRVNGLSHSGGVRFATQQCEILGQKIEKGEMIRFNVNTANLDEKVFPEPLKFDLTRANLKETWLFGAGPHFCVGAALARMVTYSFFRNFSEKYPDASIVQNPVYTRDFMARKMTEFKLRTS